MLWEWRKRRDGTHTPTVLFFFGLCQDLPPLFCSPYNADISSHLKVSCNTLPRFFKRGQEPVCCQGCTGCWLVRGQVGGSDVAPWAASSAPKTPARSLHLAPTLPGVTQSPFPSRAPPLQHSSPKVGPCCIAPKVLERLQRNQAGTFRRLHALCRHLTSCAPRFLLGITEMLNNGEGELNLCFCRD